MNTLERIDQLRNERGWSINYLAMEAMLTQSTINNLYVRKTEPKLSTLRSICNAFGISLSEFFIEDRQEEKKSPESELILQIKSLSETQQRDLLAFLKSMKNNKKYSE